MRLEVPLSLTVLMLCALSSAPRAEEPEPGTFIGRITLQPQLKHVLKKPAAVKTVMKNSPLKVASPDEVEKVSAGDQLIFSPAPVDLNPATRGHALQPWIGKPRSLSLEGKYFQEFEQAIAKAFCNRPGALEKVVKIQFAAPDRSPVVFAGDMSGSLTDARGIPTKARPFEIAVSVVTVPDMKEMENNRYLESQNYSAAIFTVDCGPKPKK